MKTDHPTFDPALLQQPIEDRLEYFNALKVDHAIQRNTFNRAIASLRCAAGPKVLVVTGPTGVGKTTIFRRIFRTIRSMHAAEMENDKSFIPVIGVNAAPPDGVSFNWRDFFSTVLLVNKDILLDHKIALTGQGEMFALQGMEVSEGSDAGKLKRALKSSVAYRKTRYLFIDEAHHILMVKDPSRLKFQFEMLKSLTIELNLTIILIGTYDLLEIREQSGQLVRRSEILHMGRYDPSVPEDRANFASAFNAFLDKMPLKIRPDFSKDMGYVFTKSAGCIGILKEWLARTYGQALEAGLDTFDADFADQFALDNKGLRTIVEEALCGELKMKDEPYEKIEKLLMEGNRFSSRFILPNEVKPKAVPGRRGRIGTRNPMRDLVGDDKYAG